MAIKEEIQTLVQDSKVDEAFDLLLTTLKRSNQQRLYDDVILLKGRHTSLKREQRLNILDESGKVEIRRIVFGLLEIAEEIEPTVSTDGSFKDSSILNEGSSIKILVLTANPKDTGHLRLDEEVRKIKRALDGAKYGARFKVELEVAVRIPDLQIALVRHQPDLVHFAGHGVEDGAILVEAEDGTAHPVTVKAMSNLFKVISERRKISTVVLNACYTEAQADAMLPYVDYVIGTKTAMPDNAAIVFAETFYRILGETEIANVTFAHNMACNSIELYNLEVELMPVLKYR